jgi:hypothetical protein
MIRAVARVVALLCISPLAANADDIVTSDYQSALLTGSYTYLPVGLSNQVNDLLNSSFTGTITGSVVFDETSLAQSRAIGFISSVSYNFQLSGTNGIGSDFGATVPVMLSDGTCQSGSASCIGITIQNNVITGATVGLIDNAYHSSPTRLSIGSTGDFASFDFNNTSLGSCTTILSARSPNGSDEGAPINPCSFTASSSMAGTWIVTSTAAPEIAPGEAGGALTLLFGIVAVTLSRRKPVCELPQQNLDASCAVLGFPVQISPLRHFQRRTVSACFVARSHG